MQIKWPVYSKLPHAAYRAPGNVEHRHNDLSQDCRVFLPEKPEINDVFMFSADGVSAWRQVG